MKYHLDEIHASRKLDLPGGMNARDLGGLPAAQGSRTQRGYCIRSDSPHNFSPETIQKLLAYGVTTVIDLRFAAELEQTPNPLANVPGLRFIHLPLLDQNDADTWDKQNPSRMAWNRAAFDHTPKRIVAVLRHIADSEGGVMFHCHAGKDRTGIIAAILLSIAGVDEAVIAQDYALSDVYLAALYDKILAKYTNEPQRQAEVWNMMHCDPHAMSAALAHVRNDFGGARAYLRQHGLEDESFEKIRSRLIKLY